MSEESNIAEYKMIKLKNIGFYLATGLFVLICLSLLFIELDIFPDNRLLNIIWNLGHVAMFAGILWLVTAAWPVILELPVVRVLPLVLVVVIIVSIPIEILQGLNGRTGSLDDILRNCLGAAAVIIFASKGFPHKFRSLKYASRLIVGALLIMVFYPFFTNTVDTFWGYRSFPVLSDFETPFEETRWVGPAMVVKQIDGGNHVLVSSFTTDIYSGLSLKSIITDWSNYGVLSFRLFNPHPYTHHLTLRIHDKQHYLSDRSYDDRFNQRIEALSGWNDYSFDLNQVKTRPKARYLNMSQIEELKIFVHKLPVAATFYFDDFRLHN